MRKLAITHDDVGTSGVCLVQYTIEWRRQEKVTYLANSSSRVQAEL